jgi:hypothetical protein
MRERKADEYHIGFKDDRRACCIALRLRPMASGVCTIRRLGRRGRCLLTYLSYVLPIESPSRYFFPLFSTTRAFSTANTFGTELARMPAMFLSASFATTPSSLTRPFFTMMWIDGSAR